MRNTITFVVFHADLKPERAPKKGPPIEGLNYEKMVSCMFQSASLFHAECRKVLLTDLDTPWRHLPAGTELYRYDIDPDRLMFERLRILNTFIRGDDFERDLVFLDSDMLINDKLDAVFDGMFDIALTHRDHDQMPINGGLFFVSKHRREAAVSFFDQILRVYQEKYSEHYDWWGDQYALTELLNEKSRSAPVPDGLTVGGARVRLLPCDIYNFSPPNSYEAIVYELDDKKILHFKGPRKVYTCV